MAHHSFDHDIDELKAVGHGALSFINMAIVLAIVAVILSTRAQTANIIAAIFAFLSWLVGQVIAPLKLASPIPLTNKLMTTGEILGGGSGSGTSAITSSQSSGLSTVSPALPSSGTGTSGTTWVSPDFQNIYHGTNPPAGYLPAGDLGSVDVNTR